MLCLRRTAELHLLLFYPLYAALKVLLQSCLLEALDIRVVFYLCCITSVVKSVLILVVRSSNICQYV